MEGFYEAGKGNTIYAAGFTLDKHAEEYRTAFTNIISIRYFRDDLRTDCAGKLELILDKEGKLQEVNKTYLGEGIAASYQGILEREKGGVRVFEETQADNAEGKQDIRSVLNIFRSARNGVMLIGMYIDGKTQIVTQSFHYETDNPIHLIPSLGPGAGFIVEADVKPTRLLLEDIISPDGNVTLGATTPNGSMYVFEKTPSGALIKGPNYLNGYIGSE